MKVNGIVKAYDEYEAVSQLRESISVVTKIDLIKDSSAQKGLHKIKEKDLSVICSQFSIILHAGLPIVQCVRMVASQNDNKAIRKMLEDVADDVGSGYGLAQSFEKNGPFLPTTFIETVRAGEEAGTLDACFDRLFNYYDNASKVRGKVVSALIYPAIVIVVAIVVLVIIMVVAVPMFTSTFEELGTELPFITRALIAVSNFFVGYWWILLGVILLCVLGWMLISRSEKGRAKVSYLMLTKFPLHQIQLMNCCSEFAANVSTVMAAGLPIIQSLNVAASVVKNYHYSTAIKAVSDDVSQGQGVRDSMSKHDCFPNMLTEMVGVGEKSGSMEQTLNVVSEYYTNEVQVLTSRLMSMMEPAITIGLAVMTCILLLAVYMPMFSMYGGM